MNIRKSTKFENAYIVKGFEIETEHSVVLYKDKTRHMFLNDAKEVDNRVQVPYVFYSRHYKKWYQDIAYISCDEYRNIMSKVKQ